MAGTLFVVCVPTKEHESNILDQEPEVESNLLSEYRHSGVRLGSRSKSEESLYSITHDELRDGQCDSSRREMFIGPWRVDASDLPSRTPRATPRPPRPPRPSRSPQPPRLRASSASRSDPEGLSATAAGREGRDLGRTHGSTHGSARKHKHIFMEKELEIVLKELKINNAVWCVGRSRKYYQVMFSVESGEPCEEALKKLADRGIGVMLDSVVSVLPCVLYYQGSEKSSAGSTEDLYAVPVPTKEDECPGAGPAGPAAGGRTQQGTWERFVQSVRSRLTVAQVVEGVRANATFTFDFLLLLIVAALVAALGLLEDSTVILVASMLISPLMGPVMAATFGTMVHDRALQRMGLVNEFAGLMLCLVIGFLTGLGVGFLDRPWPTAEMLDRGLLRSLWVNVLIAVLSGAGIAIALLRDNTGSLVGVAISASLLPPAVNAGLLWAMSLAYMVSGQDSLAQDGDPEGSSHFTTHYSSSPAVEMAVMGGISVCLTLINIVFIYLTGILMLKVKEVAPNTQAHQRFWKHDVKIARDYNTTLYGASAAGILRSVVSQEKLVSGAASGVDEGNQGRGGPVLERLLKLSAAAGFPPHLDSGDHQYLGICPLHQLTWSPSTARLGGLGDPSVSDSVRQLEDLYRTIQQHEHQQLHLNAQADRADRRLSMCALPTGPHHAAAAAAAAAARTSTLSSWVLGSSDGFRCLRAAPIEEECRCTRTFRSRPEPEESTAASAGALSTPTYHLGQSVHDQFDTPCVHANTPTTTATFLSPGDWASPPASVSVPPVPLFSVDNEAHRPAAKKRRFVVTKTEDSELLLPPDE